MELGKFAPLGNRGFIKGRGSGFGNEPWASGTLTEYMQNSNDKVLLLPQCETKDAPEFREAVDRILRACKHAGKLCMTFTSTPAEARLYIENGFDAVANSIDTITIGQAYKAMVDEIRG